MLSFLSHLDNLIIKHVDRRSDTVYKSAIWKKYKILYLICCDSFFLNWFYNEIPMKFHHWMAASLVFLPYYKIFLYYCKSS